MWSPTTGVRFLEYFHTRTQEGMTKGSEPGKDRPVTQDFFSRLFLSTHHPFQIDRKGIVKLMTAFCDDDNDDVCFLSRTKRNYHRTNEQINESSIDKFVRLLSQTVNQIELQTGYDIGPSTSSKSKIVAMTMGGNITYTICLFIIMFQFNMVRSLRPHLMPSRSYNRRPGAVRIHKIARICFSLRSKSSDRDSSKAKEAVTEYKESGLVPLEDYENPSNRDDQVFSAISEDGSVKITACTARNLVNDLMIMHTMTAVPADALGRAAVCALMMSNGMQAEQTCQITFNADGPLRGVVAISDGIGNVRGYVGSPMLGDVKLPEAVGKGMVQVVKNHPDWSNPYNGITSIRHGDIDRDIGT